ncbi:MAG: hypothetical protein R3236_06430 [Phycisphaeraceae bacterium]|nr:hypothetical protein [Phycisphaeraceae bacterium]
MWLHDQIADAVADAFEHESQHLDDEQSVYGLDALDEKRLHPLIQHGLLLEGFGVWAEQAYPSQRQGPAHAARRCDLVLTPTDQAPLENPNQEPTLFSPPETTPPEQAFWLEVKTTSQNTVEGPNRRYESDLRTAAVADLVKLRSDPLIFHAGLLLILFTETRADAERDLQRWLRLVHESGHPVGGPAVRGMDLPQRSGHGHMAFGLFPIRRG